MMMDYDGICMFGKDAGSFLPGGPVPERCGEIATLRSIVTGYACCVAHAPKFNGKLCERLKPVDEVTTETLLLSFCNYLTVTRNFHERVGVYYWPWVAKDLLEPEGPAECGICTNGALLVAQTFQGYVAGYPMMRDDEVKTLVGEKSGGHDFAVVGEFIVDWWAVAYDNSKEPPVMLVEEGIRRGLYKPRKDWRIFQRNDFRMTVKNKRKLCQSNT